MLQPAALPPPGAGRTAGMPPPVAPANTQGARMPPPMRAPGVKSPPPAPGVQDERSVSVAFKLDAIAPNSRPDVASPDEEAHFREVFQKFSEMRAQCGESTSDLTYERFLGTLQKHRDAIMQQRPDAKGVRFTVYAKEGKAALRAAPRKA